MPQQATNTLRHRNRKTPASGVLARSQNSSPATIQSPGGGPLRHSHSSLRGVGCTRSFALTPNRQPSGGADELDLLRALQCLQASINDADQIHLPIALLIYVWMWRSCRSPANRVDNHPGQGRGRSFALAPDAVRMLTARPMFRASRTVPSATVPCS